jgi:preprotein translocase subunit SecG
MLTLLAVIHIVIGALLIVFVLLQDPKGGAMGVFSGGSSSSSFFGSSGASNFLTSTTKWLAILFAASCLALTYITANRSGRSVMDNLPASAPSAPGALDSGPTAEGGNPADNAKPADGVKPGDGQAPQVPGAAQEAPKK